MSKAVQKTTKTTGSTAAAQSKTLKPRTEKSLKKPTSEAVSTQKATTSTTSQIKPAATATTQAKPQNKTKSDTAKSNSTTARATKTTTINPSKTTTNQQAITTKTSIRTKPTTTPSPLNRNQPLRANHDLVQRQKTNDLTRKPASVTSTAKTNAVLDTYHNVTVVSPPPKRRVNEAVPTTSSAYEEPTARRERARTRTLHPDEVVVLKRDSAKERIAAQIEAEQKLPKKEPIAFEVKFDDELSASKRERSKSRAPQPVEKKSKDDESEEEQANYSDDFESYESDFESDKGSTTTSSQQESTSTESETPSDGDSDNDATQHSSEDDNDSESKHNSNQNSDDESELTQYPITVIQRDKEYDRKLDSGNYEMNSRRNPKLSELQQATLQQYDSLDMCSTLTTTSEQLDSGISNYDSNSQSVNESINKSMHAAYYGGYAKFTTHPVLTKRGKDILSKIKFDTLSFVLFELKPISYEVFMQSYGKLNTTQSSTQTQEQQMSVDCQTDGIEWRTMWTQHPPQYDRESLQHLDFNVQNCCGEVVQQRTASSNGDLYEASLARLQWFQQADSKRCMQRNMRQLNKAIDIERLNAFLQRTTIVMTNVLNHAGHNEPAQSGMQLTADTAKKLTTVSKSSFQLAVNFLNALHVVRIFANARFNLVITVHECSPEANVYRSDFTQLLMIWTTAERSKPLRLLSTWSEVCHAEICNMSQDIVVCGLRDGSVAMWDLRETYSYCSKLDGYLTHFAATQTIVPHLDAVSEDSNKNASLLDSGAVVDIRSFRLSSKTGTLSAGVGNYEPIQFVSLNDTGLLTLWTLVEASKTQYNQSTPGSKGKKKSNSAKLERMQKFEYSSPWARMQLIQTAIADLRGYLHDSLVKAQSQFDKTKKLFQNNVYSDELLREFATTPAIPQHTLDPLQGLRFTSVDCGCERVYVCTNRNFILSCSRTLKVERFRKITINESKLLFPTALCVLSNEDFIAVGLSNGSVILLNCEQRQRQARHQHTERKQQSRPHTTLVKQDSSEDFDTETGKSCAIQNIILNERRSFDKATNEAYEDVDLRPSTAACIEMITNRKRPFELSVFDQQLLHSGSTLRQDLVQALALSSDGWRLFTLTNGQLRVYDFYMESELQWQAEDNSKVSCIAVARTSKEAEHLVLLQSNEEVQVHVLMH